MKKIIAAIAILLCATAVNGKVIKVDANLSASGIHDGVDWITAYVDLQQALDNASAGDDIWLAGGVYKPSRPANIFDQRTAAFWMGGGIKIYGGFNQSTNNYSFATRDPATYVVTLSGDIGVQGYMKDNCYTVIKTYSANGFATLDGVTVYGAYDANGFGGGIYLNSVSPVINNCIFANNYAAQGAGIFCDNVVGPSNPSISSCSFNNNIAAENGVYLASTNFPIVSSGGAIYNAGSSPAINACTFTGNIADLGSAICSETKAITANPYINNCTFSNNGFSSYAFSVSGIAGSVIRSTNGFPTILSCAFNSNATAGFQGSGCSGLIQGCSFSGNRAGAIMLAGASTRINNCTFSNNTNINNSAHPNYQFGASGRGGAIQIQGPTTTSIIQNCLFKGNLAVTGGGLSSYYGIADVINCTFVENTALSTGGGIYQEGRPFTVIGPQAITQGNASTSFTNCIFSGNSNDVTCQTAGVQVNGLTQSPPFTAHQATFRNCLIASHSFANGQGADFGGNIINASPQFVSPAGGNFQLATCSRCIDGGTNALPTASPATDLVNNTRIFNGTVDMGCYERQSAPSAIYKTLAPVNACAGGSATIFGITRTTSGTYTQQYAASNGCDSVVSVVFTIRSAPAAVASYINNCGTTGTIRLSPTAGTPPFNITLNGNLQTSPSGAALSYSGLTPGNYVYTISDGNSCTSSATATLTTYNIVQNTLYVDASATGSNNGLNWGNAFTDLQSALDLAGCTNFTQIWVSEGTYVPSRDPLGVFGHTANATFRMYNGLSIYGGFSTAKGAVTMAQRNWKDNRTVLSGDVQRDGVQSNNAYNVINNYNLLLDSTAVLDGFNIYGAWNNISGFGGGIINYNASPTFRNCIISENFAGGVTNAAGAGMYNLNCSPIVTNCAFYQNTVSGISNGFGGAIANENSSPRISHCTFDANVANGSNPAGGAIYSHGGNPATIGNSLFINNNSSAICSDGNNLNITNCTITGNSGTSSTPGGLYFLNCGPSILNTIIYKNANGSVSNISATPTFFYCDVEGSGAPLNWIASYGINAGANLDKNPLFTNIARLSICSPAKDAGTFYYGAAATDLDGNTRIVGGGEDMGCFEYQGNVGYGSVVYVDSAATGTNTGTSWANAFTDLQSALDLTDCFPITQIWVSKGSYYPIKDKDGALGKDRFATFKMHNGVTIYGGFSTTNNIITLAARNPDLYPTTLSGDIQRDGLPANNAYNVVTNYQNGLDSTAVLDGFIVADGYNILGISGSSGVTWGSGIVNVGVSPTFQNCTIRNNTNASSNLSFGGGMFNKRSSPKVYNCKFLNNITSGAYLAYGAGVANDSSSGSFKACIFDGNTGNAPVVVGSGMYCNRGAAISVDNCRFTNNMGGGICSDGNAIAISNTTVANNTGNINSAGGLYFLNTGPFVVNTIVWNNSGGNVFNVSAAPNFFYCNVQGSGGASWNPYYGINFGACIDADPLFDRSFGLNPCSSAIDAGTLSYLSSTTDLASKPRIMHGGNDMGAYEYGGPASASYNGIVYVDAAATGVGNGSSWSNAFTDVQQALDVAQCGGPWNIYVAKGRYYPSKNQSGQFSKAADATFRMRNGVTMYGGFSVQDGATSMATRNPEAHRTIFTGDIQNDADPSNNAYLVINNYDAGLDSTAVLDGVTVADAMNNLTGMGGGVINYNASPKFVNCVFNGNFAGGVNDARGSGMYNLSSSPILRGCTFFNNFTSGIFTAYGGGLANEISSPKLSRCHFFFNTTSAPTAIGSAMYSHLGDTVSIDNCLFDNNTGGAAIGIDGNFNFITHSTIVANNGLGIYSKSNSSFIGNSIIWANTLGSISNVLSSPNFFYCDVQGSGGNVLWNPSYGINFGASIDVDPMFDGSYLPASCSPAVNTGTFTLVRAPIDLAGNHRNLYGAPDMGCYEATTPPTADSTAPLFRSGLSLNRIQTGTTFYATCDSLIATIKSTGISPASGNIAARVFIDAAVPTFNGQAYVRRHYDFTPANAAVANSGTATITLYFTQADFDTYNAARGTTPALPTSPLDAAGIANFRITQQHGTSATGMPGSYTGWTGTGPANILLTPLLSWNGSRSRWEATIFVTGFSGFFASGNTSTPLPVSGIQLTGIAGAGYNKLRWSSIKPEIRGFEVEASNDGANFSPAGSVHPDAVTANDNTYDFWDYTAKWEVIYYRVKANTTDGGNYFSNIVRLSSSNYPDAVTLSPVPAIDKVTIVCSYPELIGKQAQFVDVVGKSIQSFIVSLKTVLDISKWQPGVYMLRLPNGDEKKIIKL